METNVKRYSLDEIRKLLGPMGSGDGEWFAMATKVRSEMRSALRQDGFNDTDIGLTVWNFDTYVTTPDFVVFDANCITFIERDYDRDLYFTDLPFAVANGTMTPREWVDSVLQEARERLTERRLRREERERQQREQREQNERAELARLQAKYGKGGS